MIIDKFALIVTLGGTLIVSCSAPASQQVAGDIEQAANTSTPLARSVEAGPTLTGIVPAEAEQMPFSTVTPTSTIMPSPACEHGTLVFTAQAMGYMNPVQRGSIYWACPNGTSLQQVLSNEELSFGSLAASPTRALAISAIREDSPTLMSTLFRLDLDSFSLSELRTAGQGEFEPRWSANGQYLAYLIHSPALSETPPETHIEILHLASGVKSEIQVAGLSDFDWAPDGVKAVFGTWVIPEGNPHGLEVYRVYVGEITCGDETHVCQLSDVREIPNVARQPSWLDTEVLVSTTRGIDTNTLLITDLQGNIIQEIDLDRLASPATTATWPKASSDGRYIAFIGGDNGLYIVDLNMMALRKISFDVDPDLYVVAFDWLN